MHVASGCINVFWMLFVTGHPLLWDEKGTNKSLEVQVQIHSYRMGFQDATNTIKTATLLFFSLYSPKCSLTTILTFTHIISMHFWCKLQNTYTVPCRIWFSSVSKDSLLCFHPSKKELETWPSSTIFFSVVKMWQHIPLYLSVLARCAVLFYTAL